MAEIHTDIAKVFDGLAPVSRWFGVISAMTALSIWTYSSKEWHAWPQPVRCLVWGWLTMACVAPLYIIVYNWLTGLVGKAAAATVPEFETVRPEKVTAPPTETS